MLSMDSSSFDSPDFMKMHRYQIFKMHCGSSPVITELTLILSFLGSRHSGKCFPCVLLFNLWNSLCSQVAFFPIINQQLIRRAWCAAQPSKLDGTFWKQAQLLLVSGEVKGHCSRDCMLFPDFLCGDLCSEATHCLYFSLKSVEALQHLLLIL